jgi:NADH-quinone oxidoreductase subunit M
MRSCGEMMEIFGGHILSLIVFLPMVGFFLILFLGRENTTAVRVLSLIIMTLDFVIALLLFLEFNGQSAEYQFVERYNWIPAWKIHYQLGVDGISLLLVELTALLGPVVVLSSWSAVKDRIKEYHAFLLLLQTGMMGAFLALDLIMFYVFWELMLVPMYFLIGAWGGPRRIYAAVKFFLFTMAGSVLMLVAIIFLFSKVGSFDLVQISNYLGNNPFRLDLQITLFAAFALAFAIKVPMWPLHTWLPDAHVEAPTAGSVILAGVLLKMGTYGFIRFAIPLFPDAVTRAVPYMSVLALIGIIYGALVSLVQEDVKKLVAYSSVSHLGFVVLGLFALTVQSVQGALIQMVNHGLSTGALFLLVGIIYERAHTRQISDFGGLSKVMPVYAAFFLIVSLSSIGLPGLNGFVGEFLILVGTFISKNPHSRIYAMVAGTGVIFAAAYLLYMYQRMFFGPLKREENKTLKDMNAREILYLLIIMVFIVWIGVYPKTFLGKSEATVQNLVTQVENKKVYKMKTAATRAPMDGAEKGSAAAGSPSKLPGENNQQ